MSGVAEVYPWCMARTNIDIDEEACAAVMRRYGCKTKREAVNLALRQAARSMKPHKRGAIVNISSGAGRTYTRTGVQAYAAAKAGVIGLTRQIARELGPHGIRVNCIAPGLISVRATHEEIRNIPDEAMKAHLANVALGRLGKPDDLVGPVLFFLGSDAEYVTGQTISVDGGSIMLG